MCDIMNESESEEDCLFMVGKRLREKQRGVNVRYAEYNRELIKDYWNRYVAGYETIPEHLDGLDDRILQSWKRSKSKANPFERHPVLLSAAELESLTKEKQNLIKIAVPYMIKFYEIAEKMTQNVLLTDEEGRQLKNVSANDRNLMEIMSNAFVANGSNYAEDECGTSSIALALYEDSPILLRGYEHYRAIYQNLSCFSIPIHSLGRKQVGCICITGSLDKFDPIIASAGLMMVQAIENELQLTQSNLIMEIITQNFTQGFILLDSKQKILKTNDKAMRLLRINQKLENQCFDACFSNDFNEILELGKKHGRNKFSYVLSKTNGFVVSVSLLIVPIKENNQEDLYLLIFSSMDEANKEASKKVGYTARYYFKDIVGESEEIKKVKELCGMAANSKSSVLILGESGTGREVLAQAIHNEGVRKEAPFITIHCGSVPKEMMETELFGDEENCQIGKLELADGGTLFLDEIEKLSIECQTRLFAFMNHQVLRHDKIVDVRIIACSQKDLFHLVNSNQFTADLYYKLNVISVVIPPLRKRRNDIRVLIHYYTNHYRKLLKKDVENIEKKCMEVLLNYNWPGNVRELESTIERLVNMASGTTMRFVDLPDEIVTGYFSQKYESSEVIQEVISPESIEYGKIIKTLKKEHGHMKTVATILNMPLSTLYRKCKKYNIEPQKYREW